MHSHEVMYLHTKNEARIFCTQTGIMWTEKPATINKPCPFCRETIIKEGTCC
jgi:hypothetical protein